MDKIKRWWRKNTEYKHQRIGMLVNIAQVIFFYVPVSLYGLLLVIALIVLIVEHIVISLLVFSTAVVVTFTIMAIVKWVRNGK